MTIKKRLAISNVLMILVPVVISALIALLCVGIIWFTVARGTGLEFEDSEDFVQACAGITALASDALRKENPQEALESLTVMLDRAAMSLRVTADGEEFFHYGETEGEDAHLNAAALALENEGTLITDTRNLRVTTLDRDGVMYTLYLYNTPNALSYTSLKVAVALAGSVLLLTILLSVFFVDRFLTRFVWRHIEEPLTLLSDGVRQIRDGNLEHRLEYREDDEFLPVCRDFNDMAERLRQSVEQSRREEESRKELMADISHDLRTPLTSIQAYVEGLLDGVAKTPEARRRYLMTIKSRAEELECMVARILAYSRLELESAPRVVVPLRLDTLLKEEIGAMAADYAGRGLTLTCEVEPFTVSADAGELRQLIANIADNSLKYREKPKAMLRVTLRNEGETGLLLFEDDGPGVPKEALGRLFGLFYRADPSRSDRGKGSGLGLAIVEKTARRMGGTVRAENAPSGGLRILVRLPKGENTDVEDTDH